MSKKLGGELPMPPSPTTLIMIETDIMFEGSLVLMIILQPVVWLVAPTLLVFSSG